MSSINERIAALTAEQQKLVGLSLASRGNSIEFNLSFAQLSIWASARFSFDTSAYNNPVCLKVQGRLDPDTLGRAVAAVVNRHEPLRARFSTLGGRVSQRFGPVSAVPFPVTVDDLSEAGSAEELALALADKETRIPFDLGAGPPLRVRILRVGPDASYMLVTLHHLVSDGWSLGVFLSELQTAYDGRMGALPPLRYLYRDFVREQWGGAHVPETVARVRRWCGRVTEGVAVPTFRGVSECPAGAGGSAGRRPFTLSPAVVAAVTRAAAGVGATFGMAVLSAWAEVLTARSDLAVHLIGVPIAGRHRLEREPLVGAFVDLAVCRIDLSAGPTREQLLRQTREVLADALDHQDVPFVRVVDAFRAAGFGAALPVPTLVVVQNTPWPEFRLGGAALSVRETDSGVTRFELELHVWPWPEGVRGWLSYRSDAVRTETAEEILTEWLGALERIATDPVAPCRRPGLSQGEKAPPAARPVARVPPRSDLERAVARVWGDLLPAIEGLSVDIPFFDYGGHSLLLVELQERLRITFGRTIPILDLLARPTIADIAAGLRDRPEAPEEMAGRTPMERAAAQRAALTGRRASHVTP